MSDNYMLGRILDLESRQNFLMQVEQFPLNSPTAVCLGSLYKALGWGTHPFLVEHLHMCAGILTNQQKTEPLF